MSLYRTEGDIELKKVILLVVISVWIFNGNLLGQDHQSAEKSAQDYSEEAHHDINHLAVFIGGTAMLENKGTYFSLGLDYLSILSTSRNWGAGGFAEVIFAKYPEWVFGGLIYYRLINQLFIRTGPGIEILRHEEIDLECNCTHVKSETEFLYRIGIGYSYHKESLILSPTIDLDIVRSASALVFGVNIGFAF
jgi:hypothetical protein